MFFPLYLAIGIFAYFNNFLELKLDLSFLVFFCFIEMIIIKAAYFFYYKYENYWLYISYLIRILTGILFISLGYTTSLCRDIYMEHPVLTKQIDSVQITGYVYDIDFSNGKTRLYLNKVEFDNQNYYSLFTVKRWLANDNNFSFMNIFHNIFNDHDNNMIALRITARSLAKHVHIGDKIHVQVNLLPPPPSALPNSFDFAQYSYFKGLSAIGYATNKIFVYKSNENSEPLRKILAEKLINILHSPYGNVAAGMLVGEGSSIPNDDYNAVRVAGTAHLIAISGMHIVIIGSIIFLLLRILFIMIARIYPSIYLYCDWRKYSAFFAILFSCAYLFLSGMPISGQRAVLSSSIVFAAIIWDVHHNSWKALSVSAFLILFLMPETLFNPSLQMSFAACIALIALWRYSFTRLNSNNYIFKYIYSLIFSSIFASFATAPFIAYHFNSFSLYSVLANLICVPLTDFIIMPIGLISMILMQLNLECFFSTILKYSIQFFLFISHSVASLPYASIYIPSPSQTSCILLIIGIGFFACQFFDLFKNFKLFKKLYNIKNIVLYTFAGTFIISSISYTLIFHELPRAIVSDHIFAVKYNNKLFLSSKQKSKYIRKIWEQKLGIENFSSESLEKHKLHNCDAKLCLMQTSENQPYRKDLQGSFILISNYESDDTEYNKIYEKICDNYSIQVAIYMKENLMICKNASKVVSWVTIQKEGSYLVK